MAAASTIEWTGATWNPITGCSHASPGCKHCFAQDLAGSRLRSHASRAGLTQPSKAGPVWTGEVRLNEKWLDQPLRWARPREIFVCAHGDLFHESVPDAWIDRVFAVMALAQQHTFQVLTKRSARMRAYCTDLATPRRIWELVCDLVLAGAPGCGDVVLIAPVMDERAAPPGRRLHLGTWPLPNVWKGVSVEDQTRADERLPELFATPAALRWMSGEPLLGPVDLSAVKVPIGGQLNALSGHWASWPLGEVRGQAFISMRAQQPTLDWVVVGGESGRGARPMHPQWARQLRDQCAAAGVPFFFKQWGAWVPFSEWPDDEAAYDRLYHPAPASHPVAMRRARFPETVLHADGSRHGPTSETAYSAGSGAMLMFEVGKKAAGRMLCAVQHDARPIVAPHA